jgi:hypothetical protein
MQPLNDIAMFQILQILKKNKKNAIIINRYSKSNKADLVA